MPTSPMRSHKRLSTTLLALVVVFLTFALVFFPEDGYKAGMAGMKLFWDVVFPSLLPFFILSELLLGVGVVQAIGVLLEPLMRALFRVPGVGAFTLSMNLAAGYPMNAVIVGKFRKNKLCTRNEGERLLAFTNTVDPLFLFGAVAAVMFRSPQLGMLLAVAHYLAALLVGLLFRFTGSDEPVGVEEVTMSRQATDARPSGNIFRRAYAAMIQSRHQDGRPLGKLLGDAVNESIKTSLMILGFIMFFSVLVKILSNVGFLALLALPFQALFQLFQLDLSLVQPFLAGLFEIDFGAAQVAASTAPLAHQMILISFLLAWSGLAVHAQVASVLIGTDIRLSRYAWARLLHAVLASICALVLWNMGWGQEALTVMANFMPMMSALQDTGVGPHWGLSWLVLKNWSLLFGSVVLLSLVFHFFRSARFVAWSSRSSRR